MGVSHCFESLNSDCISELKNSATEGSGSTQSINASSLTLSSLRITNLPPSRPGLDSNLPKAQIVKKCSLRQKCLKVEQGVRDLGSLRKYNFNQNVRPVWVIEADPEAHNIDIET